MKLANRTRRILHSLALVTALTTLTSGVVDVHSARLPAQFSTTITSTVSSTVTSTSSTAISLTSTMSSTILTTATSVTTLSSTVMTLGGSGGPGSAIPGFPWEAILVGVLLGVAVLGILRRKRTAV
ncbi:MAG: hypothetical protein ABSF09_08400 [Candidatus Bathyarchaeia archaeon]